MISLEKLFDLTGGTCCYCGCQTYLPRSEPRAVVAARFGLALGQPGVKKALRRRTATREHIVRKADGGGDNRRNLTIACHLCNITRGAASPDQHRAAIARAVAAGIHPNHTPKIDLTKGALRRARRAVGLCPEIAESSHVG
ncbi:HNH endonuclease [Methylorubrum suomiense]|uniref:HNH domain-containing protein n=1 Tax=Methylorubrum suomiense TaxID=144191 RepID=A0ABQ4UZJ6_9HYPH|nr:HNH endonuclease [Methylorubrum suomiense]GJE77761.1 hypothetical protein BGCPKDLD_4368 [Methylorubrum suomiense]